METCIEEIKVLKVQSSTSLFLGFRELCTSFWTDITILIIITLLYSMSIKSEAFPSLHMLFTSWWAFASSLGFLRLIQALNAKIFSEISHDVSLFLVSFEDKAGCTLWNRKVEAAEVWRNRIFKGETDQEECEKMSHLFFLILL